MVCNPATAAEVCLALQFKAEASLDLLAFGLIEVVRVRCYAVRLEYLRSGPRKIVDLLVRPWLPVGEYSGGFGDNILLRASPSEISNNPGVFVQVHCRVLGHCPTVGQQTQLLISWSLISIINNCGARIYPWKLYYLKPIPFLYLPCELSLSIPTNLGTIWINVVLVLRGYDSTMLQESEFSPSCSASMLIFLSKGLFNIYSFQNCTVLCRHFASRFLNLPFMIQSWVVEWDMRRM